MDLVPDTLPSRFYLRGEIGKLRRTGDATDFLAAVDHDLLDRRGLPKDVTGLSACFQAQSRSSHRTVARASAIRPMPLK